ncbi:pentatricopeptide repeat-containing protein At5g03800 [Mercurialis annua]|uniref:pentatricopeptide repeat-containing protein At5g03800 n=1 Tax=Mercurialis annua TaxID=3986 RepID=UPI00216072B0|nr:pentatricopeptide repeat-containing protein At5g03800 [Mercurialis annua]
MAITTTIIQTTPSPLLHSQTTPPFSSPTPPSSLFTKPHHHHHPRFSISTAQPPPSPIPTHHKNDLFSNPSVIDIDIDHLLYLLRISAKYTDINLARALHASILKLGDDTYLGNALIIAYSRLGLVSDAYHVFKGLSDPDVVSYNALVSCFVKGNQELKGIELFFRMRSSSIEANEYGFVSVLTACSRILKFELGFQIHGLLMKMGFVECVFVMNALMFLYGKAGFLDSVAQVFDETPQRDVATWNTMISSLVNESLYGKALDLFRDFCGTTSLRGDQFTLSSVLTACAEGCGLMGGREVHAHAFRIGLEANMSVNNALIKLYTKYGSLKEVVSVFERMPVRDVITWTEMIVAYMNFGSVQLAVELFEKMPERNSVSYNAMLSGFCNNGEGMMALGLFFKIIRDGLEVTDFTLTSLASACGMIMRVEISRQIHAFIIKFGIRSNPCIETALLDMYTRCGRMRDADKMLRGWPSNQENSIIRTSMLCGYARNGMPEEAISLFQQSVSEGTIVADEVTLTSILGVCGTLGFQGMGEQIHCHALKTGFVADVGVGNSIISMYSKCYNLKNANKSFNTMPAHDLVSWNCLISGYLLHRQGDEALAVWSRMEKEGIKPDSVTFVLVISAYNHTKSNLVEVCRCLFFSMENIYDIKPTSEHYASFVSVLGCWGLLEEAEEMINKMPFNPEVSVWRALLDSCRLHQNSSIGKRVAKHILTMEPQDPSTYALISNLYSASGRWHCSDIVRANMRERRIQKHPCRSWIILQKKVHSFYVRDKFHPCVKDIYSGLDVLILECLKAGYKPDTSFVLHEVEEHQKKDFLFYHSAKLAATYGLLVTRPGEPIRIVKNILLCGDCHAFLKFASSVTGREILLRDTSGFHHFSNGQCSCKDYWR